MFVHPAGRETKNDWAVFAGIKASFSVQSWRGSVFTFQQVTAGFRSSHVRTLVE
jgi:hypothetical protein